MEFLRITLIVSVIALVVCSALLILFIQSKRKKRRIETPPLDESQNFKIYPFSEIQTQLNAGLPELKQQGELLSQVGVDSAYFIHGTFLGNDPFHIIDFLETTFQRLDPIFAKRIKNGIRKAVSILARDIGNFSNKYEQLFVNVTNHKIKTHEFTWSSANNHLARVKAALELTQSLYTKHPTQNTRVLLIGHSHAGQIFSLVTKMMKDEKFRINLFKILDEFNISYAYQDKYLEHLKKLYLDFVTLGTPVRYQWDLSDRTRVLHFINHRGESPYGGELSGVITTKTGDYIQQWGTEGSDLFTFSRRDQSINAKLDLLLGSGRNVLKLKENIAKKNRLHNQGKHLLIDYGDNSIFPNFIKTALGHGAYTQIKYLPFHLEMIYQNFYEKKKLLS